MSRKRSIDLIESPEQSRSKLPAIIEPRITLEGPNATLRKTGFERTHKRWQALGVDSPSDQGQSSDDYEDDVDLENKSHYTLAPMSIQTAPEPQICLGMIHDAKTKVLDVDDLSEAFANNLPDDDSEYHQLETLFTDCAIFVGTSSAARFAVMNEETARALQRLAQLKSCLFKTYITSRSLHEYLNRDPKTEKVMFLNVDIVIYVTQTCRISAGRFLSSARIYLQHPSQQDNDTEYNNPHVLDLVDLFASSSLSPISNARTRTPINDNAVSNSENAVNRRKIQDQSFTAEALLETKIAKIFSSLTRSKNLKRLEADIKITTRLLPHQEEALDFMAQRELGPIPSAYSLWAILPKRPQICYEHIVTGLRSEGLPKETIGGILADDMGLGKTLTVLSTIIRTAEIAKTYAGDNGGSLDILASDGPQRLRSRATLVIVPSLLLIDGWEKEVKTHCEGSLNLYTHHGRGRELDAKTLTDYDIVFSTYQTIAAEAMESHAPLNQIDWFRVVLDEAHIIRNMNTKLFKAVSMLSGRFRWCLTGTPIQNSIEDLASLAAFIRSYPLNNITEFRKHIISPVIKQTEEGFNSLRTFLDSICLRRTKRLLNLPTTTYQDRHVDFTAAEKAFYAETQAALITAIQAHDGSARNLKDYFGVFQLQLQLRRLCNHGTYQKDLSQSLQDDNQFDPGELFELLRKKGKARCAYCIVPVTLIGTIADKMAGKFTVCGHLLCSSCIPTYSASLGVLPAAELQCSLCPRKVPPQYIAEGDNASSHSSTIRHQTFNRDATSSKVSALVEEIENNTSQGKSIVFSCWTRSLDLVQDHLSLKGIEVARIDGTHTFSQRQHILDDYHNNDQIRILLMTTGTGAVGLNLTIASTVYILEPQWNPMVEKQAIARVSRLGQAREVKVVRFIMNATVEESMRSQQIRKLGYARLGWRED